MTIEFKGGIWREKSFCAACAGTWHIRSVLDLHFRLGVVPHPPRRGTSSLAYVLAVAVIGDIRGQPCWIGFGPSRKVVTFYRREAGRLLTRERWRPTSNLALHAGGITIPRDDFPRSPDVLLTPERPHTPMKFLISSFTWPVQRDPNIRTWCDAPLYIVCGTVLVRVGSHRAPRHC